MSDLYHIQPLFDLIDAYRRATSITDSTLSTRLFNDGKKIAQLRAGSSLTLRSATEAVGWFSVNWPIGTAWPDGIPRPSSPPTTPERVGLPTDSSTQSACYVVSEVTP